MLVLLGVLAFTGTGRAVGPLRGHGGGHGEPGAAQAGDRGHDGRGGIDLHNHLHAHGDYLHRHPHGHGPDGHGHADDRTPLARLDRSGIARTTLYQWLRPFAVGLVHGLAGSAAVALMVLSIIREPLAGIGYLLLFGIGTVAGMMLITLILSAPFAFTATSLPAINRRLRLASGLVSVAFGVFLIWDIGFADGGLFTAAPAWEPR
jgi:high-affinity nickel-transport protein